MTLENIRAAELILPSNPDLVVGGCFGGIQLLQVLYDTYIQRRVATVTVENNRVVGQFLRCRWFWIDGDRIIR